jgi:hypothetical protein
LARAAITFVASESAGPPCGGLYLKPPSAGRVVRRGDDDAVREADAGRHPSTPVILPRLAVRIACETAGVGV